MHETAYAKVNLALHVRARAADGYHRIETVFAFCEDGDLLSVSAGEGLSLAVRGPFAADLAGEENNLVLRAARALAKHAGIEAEGALTLDKRLPVASGIGGGSADAAAALRLLGRFWRLAIEDADLYEVAASLGADVPACLASQTMRGEGRGDTLALLDNPGLTGTPILLVNPRIPVSTAAVFQAWDGLDRGSLDVWREGRNDLEKPARGFASEIGDVLAALSDAQFVRMSGSGATCFGLFQNDALRRSTSCLIADQHPDWWTLESRLR